MNKIFLLLLIVSTSQIAEAQSKKRVQAGVLYKSGDMLYAPRLGFTATVPEGWEGQMPRDVEVFMLSSLSGHGQIYILGKEKGEIESFRDSWQKGISLNESMTLKSVGDLKVQDNTIEGEVMAAGASINKSFRGYAIAKCSEFGPCVSVLMVCPAQFYDEAKKAVMSFMGSSAIGQPSNESPYVDFDWKEFLSGKMLMTYLVVESASKDTQIHLCADGKFLAEIRKKGLMKNQNPQYKGKLKGSWSVEGKGEKTKFTLKFEKELPPLEVELNINDEKIYVEGERYFAGYSDYCK